MIEVIVLSSDDKKSCPFYRFTEWDSASSFIKFNVENGYSCEVNGVEDGTIDRKEN